MNLHHALAAALLAASLAGCSTEAQAPVTITTRAGAQHKPSPPLIGTLNPAVTQATIRTTICVPGWTAKVRPPTKYTTALKRSQLPTGTDPAAYEEDHLMPLALGGAPKDPANLRPVPLARAKADDVWETRLHRKVCAGSLSLAAAQRAISAVKRGES